jgi:hypothetical protein
MPRNLLLAVIAIIAIAIGLIVWRMPSTPAPAPSTTTAAPTEAVPAGAIDSDAAVLEHATEATPAAAGQAGAVESTAPIAIALPATLPPLPPTDLPLREQLDALVARANAGDGEAACRLVIEGERCDHLLRRRMFVKAIESGRVGGPRDDGGAMAVEMAARVAESVAAEGAHCDDLDIVKVPDVDESLANALGRLSVRQKVVLAMLRVDGSLARLHGDNHRMMMPSNSSGQLTPQFYSDHLQRFLDEGIAAGDMLALEGKIMLHQPTTLPKDIFGVRLALPDQYRFALHARALLLLNGAGALGSTFTPVLDNVLAALSPSRRAQLDREVDQLVAAMRSAQARRPAGATPVAADAAGLCAG